jgi:hypothetical protein
MVLLAELLMESTYRSTRCPLNFFSFKRKCHTNELTPFIICGALEGLNRKIEAESLIII